MYEIIKKVKERKQEVVDQMHLNAKASIEAINANVENDLQLTVRYLLRPMVC
jgi:F0F1-type ATP synthase membrane subunit b/b'